MSREIDAALARDMLPERPSDGHKGTFGHVCIIGGAPGYAGAPRLAALGAARSGAGLVTVAVPETLLDVVAGSLMECMTYPLAATPEGSLSAAGLAAALELTADKQGVALGPGLARHPETAAFVLGFVRDCNAPVVIDADGLNALASDTGILRGAAGPRVVTPHPGEMARLIGATVAAVQSDREGAAVSFARERDCVVVLKGAGTVIASAEGRVLVNPTGNSGMGTGGTGDVLAGLLAGLLAQGMPAFEAAALAVYAHGLAGDIAAERMTGRGMIAGDVLDALPQAWKQIERGT